jgi:acyl-CoA reductase-like NAD-dependent aldehyde dehydrogenase
VLKPATQCPLAVIQCVERMNKHLPSGVLTVVTGSGQVVGEKLAADERVRAIAFTGSTETGRRIMELASHTVKKVFLELGGNDPAIVLDDANLDDTAIAKMTNAILRASGQVCIAIKRIYVHISRYDELVAKLSESFAKMIVGDGLAVDTTMGPLNNASQFGFVSDLVEESRQAELDVRTYGTKRDPGTWDQGYYILPSIILGASERDRIVTCEQFGPVIPIMPFTSADDAVSRANHTPYGLRASIWTADHERAANLADRVQAGAVFWNNHGIFRDLHIEFPGVKQSGLSRESRAAALDHYVDTYGFAQ